MKNKTENQTVRTIEMTFPDYHTEEVARQIVDYLQAETRGTGIAAVQYNRSEVTQWGTKIHMAVTTTTKAKDEAVMRMLLNGYKRARNTFETIAP